MFRVEKRQLLIKVYSLCLHKSLKVFFLSRLLADIQLLEDKHSPKRRSAAKRLRKLGDVAAGPALLKRAKKEVLDPRTWETQYQLIMAIGECEYVDALPFLESLSETKIDAAMVYVGIGDALVRLKSKGGNDVAPVLSLMLTDNHMLVNGAFRAMAMLKMVPSDDAIDAILEYVSKFGIEHSIRFWPLAASAGWNGDNVEKYVSECSQSSRHDLQHAVKLASEGKYYNWRPL